MMYERRSVTAFLAVVTCFATELISIQMHQVQQNFVNQESKIQLEKIGNALDNPATPQNQTQEKRENR
jgi:hypothetical protein